MLVLTLQWLIIFIHIYIFFDNVLENLLALKIAVWV